MKRKEDEFTHLTLNAHELANISTSIPDGRLITHKHNEIYIICMLHTANCRFSLTLVWNIFSRIFLECVFLETFPWFTCLEYCKVCSYDCSKSKEWPWISRNLQYTCKGCVALPVIIIIYGNVMFSRQFIFLARCHSVMGWYKNSGCLGVSRSQKHIYLYYVVSNEKVSPFLWARKLVRCG